MRPTYWYFPKYNWSASTNNFDLLAVNVVVGVPDPRGLPPSPDLVMGRKARTLAEVWGLEPPRAPFAGQR
jgi:hypothetical protein